MGMPFRIVLYAAEEEAANRGAAAAFARIAELDAKLSDYSPDSELTRLNQRGPETGFITVSDDLYRVLQAGQDLAARTGGAFDVTSGPLVKIWRRARRRRVLPAAEDLERARAATGYRDLKLGSKEPRVAFRKAGLKIDLGGIAVGYALDEARRVLHGHGIEACLIDASGDILAGASPPGQKGWRISLELFSDSGGGNSKTYSARIHDLALATSGDAYQHAVIDGKRYSHIVDPRTGWALTTPCQVTVFAPRGIAADGWSTAVSVLGPEAGFNLIDEMSGLAAIMGVWTAGGVQEFHSQRFDEVLRLNPQTE